MLILTRRVGETVMIGNEITFTVLGTKGNQVRVGITAPKHIAVHREEIYQRIQGEKVTNILERRSVNSSVRPLDTNLESATKISTSAHSEPERNAHGCVEPYRRRLMLSPQTRKELLKW